MELDEMKIQWNEISVELQNQKKLTDLLVVKMTKAEYRNKLNKIVIPEALGAVICLVACLLIGINFQQLNTWYLQGCGIAAGIILFILPIASIKAICKMRAIKIAGGDLKKSLLQYSKATIQFVYVQKVSFLLSAILLVVLLPVMGKILTGKDVFLKTQVWLWYAIAFPFFAGFAQWVFKSYTKATVAAENILKELQEEA